MMSDLRRVCRELHKQIEAKDAEIERLRAVVDASRHLLAGGDKEAVYHLEKALAALEVLE